MKNILLVIGSLCLILTSCLGRKLVCSQPDGSTEALKGYCRRQSTGECQCTQDCDYAVSLIDCVCANEDLAYARDQKLANCTVWTQGRWLHYVKTIREEIVKGVILVPASNTPDGKGLLFPNTNEGLPWPITDVHSDRALTVHGPHCLHMIQMFNEQISNGQPLNNLVDRLHSEHCRRLARRVLALFETQANYRVEPTSLCSAIRKSQLRNLGLLVEGVTSVEARLGLLVEGVPSVQVTDHLELLVEGVPAVQVIVEPFRRDRLPNQNSSATIVTESHLVYTQLHEKAKQLLNSSHVPNQFMQRMIAGQNRGIIEVREWLEKPLTRAEQRYFDSWKSERVLQFAALGIYCQQGHGQQAPIEYIRNLLTMKE